mgnify:CR=1 FL=1
MTDIKQAVRERYGRAAVQAGSCCGARKSDPIIQAAGDIACRDLIRRLVGARPSDRYFRSVTTLGKEIADGGWKSFIDFEPDAIMMGYEQ